MRRRKRHRLLGLLALPLLGYAALCAWMYFQQRDLVYHPQATRLDAVHTNFELRHDGVTLRGWVVNPGQRDALVYFGGNAEPVRGMSLRLAEWFPDHTHYVVAYRGYGASEGEPSEAALLADGVALFDRARQQHLTGRISVIGRSLGTGVAGYVASQRDVDGLVLVTPFDSLVNVAQGHYPWLPVRWLATERFETQRHLAGYDKPVLVVRAGRDQVVPPERADRLAAALPGSRVHDVPEASHDSVISGADTVEVIVSFLDR
ncbi:MAG: lysophospholipase [Arenimonas sp.]|uniref:alpha/beta hydrolase n=1 Tax=Arenimonas sp. TaxID=1872635 RepID=UPI0025BEEF06|nr:alpha/beta hydrolase [Arenimonas sp.]MBW8368984.1 lysophospholipase [Arenimonas sp.]